MRTMKIFEPAMCCPTGLCGVGVDPELLRVSTVLNTLKQKRCLMYLRPAAGRHFSGRIRQLKMH